MAYGEWLDSTTPHGGSDETGTKAERRRRARSVTATPPTFTRTNASSNLAEPTHASVVSMVSTLGSYPWSVGSIPTGRTGDSKVERWSLKPPFWVRFPGPHPAFTPCSTTARSLTIRPTRDGLHRSRRSPSMTRRAGLNDRAFCSVAKSERQHAVNVPTRRFDSCPSSNALDSVRDRRSFVMSAGEFDPPIQLDVAFV